MMEKYINRDDCVVAYDYLTGTHPVTVILLHGYGLHREMWQPQVAFLQAQGYPVINIDVRGHGNSRPTASFSVKQAATDLDAIITAENLTHYVLCGLSMGGFVVQEYAFLFGGALGYMVTGVTPLFMRYPKWEKWLLENSTPMMKYFYTWNGLKKAMVEGSAYTEAAKARLSTIFDAIEKDEFLVSWKGFTTCLHEETVVFDAPLLVVAGEHDTRGTIMKHLSEWESLYTNSRVTTIADAGHVANLDNVEQFNEILRSFINSCEASIQR